MVAQQTETVLEAMEEFRQAHARYQLELSEVWRRRRKLTDQWLREMEPVVEEFLGERDVDDDEVELELRGFLFSGDPDRLDLLAYALDTLAGARRPFMEQLSVDRRRLGPAMRAVELAHQRLAPELRQWVEDLRAADGNGPAIAEWPLILKAWRDSTGLTAREAAELLEVSPSTVWRYEEAERTPSLQSIASMVANINASPGFKPHETDRREAADYLASEGLAGTATELLEQAETTVDAREQKESIREEIKSALDHLDDRELDAVAALVINRAALPALVDWADAHARHPLQPVIDALTGSGPTRWDSP